MPIFKKSKEQVEVLLKEAYDSRGIDLQKSKDKTLKALEISRSIDDTALIGKSLNRLSLFSMIAAENETAISLAEEAITYFQKDSNELEIANAKYTIAGVYYKTNNYHLGMLHLLDCLTTYRKLGDKHGESKTQKSLGAIYEFMGDRSNAIEAYKEAVKCAREAGDRNLESNAYNPLSGIYLKLEDTDKAMSLAQRSITIKKETGDTRGYAFAVYARGKVLLSLGSFQKALSDFNEALAIHLTASDAFGIAMCYNKIARLYIAFGDTHTAKNYLEKAINFSIDNNLSLNCYKAYYILYEINKSHHNYELALKYLELHNKVKDESLNSQTLKVIKNYERLALVQFKENEAVMERERSTILNKQQRAEQESEVRQNFLSAMSHEIRTPLNAIISIISLLKDQYESGDQTLLHSLQFSASNLMQIINDILDFSKLDSNKMVLEQHPVGLPKLLENIKQTYLTMAQEKGLELELQLKGNFAKAYNLDETKLFQVIGNLVSNAIKFTDNGRVSIKAVCSKKNRDHDTVCISVTDSGRGIPSSEIKQLFDSFYIPQSITTRNDGGTGLGLAIVKKLVQMHDSHIEVESEVGKGSRFSFNLELKKEKASIKTEKQLTENLENKVAIVAEDNEINALVMNRLLSKWGITFKRAKNGQEAINLAMEEKVDFILMDIHMPVVNGYQATKEIRNPQCINSDTLILALTADITAENTEDDASLFDGFLWKPIEIDRLFEALAKDYFIKETA